MAENPNETPQPKKGDPLPFNNDLLIPLSNFVTDYQTARTEKKPIPKEFDHNKLWTAMLNDYIPTQELRGAVYSFLLRYIDVYPKFVTENPPIVTETIDSVEDNSLELEKRKVALCTLLSNFTFLSIGNARRLAEISINLFDRLSPKDLNIYLLCLRYTLTDQMEDDIFRSLFKIIKKYIHEGQIAGSLLFLSNFAEAISNSISDDGKFVQEELSKYLQDETDPKIYHAALYLFAKNASFIAYNLDESCFSIDQVIQIIEKNLFFDNNSQYNNYQLAIQIIHGFIETSQFFTDDKFIKETLFPLYHKHKTDTFGSHYFKFLINVVKYFELEKQADEDLDSKFVHKDLIQILQRSGESIETYSDQVKILEDIEDFCIQNIPYSPSPSIQAQFLNVLGELINRLPSFKVTDATTGLSICYDLLTQDGVPSFEEFHHISFFVTSLVRKQITSSNIKSLLEQVFRYLVLALKTNKSIPILINIHIDLTAIMKYGMALNYLQDAIEWTHFILQNFKKDISFILKICFSIKNIASIKVDKTKNPAQYSLMAKFIPNAFFNLAHLIPVILDSLPFYQVVISCLEKLIKSGFVPQRTAEPFYKELLERPPLILNRRYPGKMIPPETHSIDFICTYIKKYPNSASKVGVKTILTQILIIDKVVGQSLRPIITLFENDLITDKELIFAAAVNILRCFTIIGPDADDFPVVVQAFHLVWLSYRKHCFNNVAENDLTLEDEYVIPMFSQIFVEMTSFTDQSGVKLKPLLPVIDSVPTLTSLILDFILHNVSLGEIDSQGLLQRAFNFLPFPYEVVENEQIIKILLEMINNESFSYVLPEISLVFAKLLLLRDSDLKKYNFHSKTVSEMREVLKKLARKNPDFEDYLEQQFPDQEKLWVQIRKLLH